MRLEQRTKRILVFAILATLIIGSGITLTAIQEPQIYKAIEPGIVETGTGHLIIRALRTGCVDTYTTDANNVIQNWHTECSFRNADYGDQEIDRWVTIAEESKGCKETRTTDDESNLVRIKEECVMTLDHQEVMHAQLEVVTPMLEAFKAGKPMPAIANR